MDAQKYTVHEKHPRSTRTISFKMPTQKAPFSSLFKKYIARCRERESEGGNSRARMQCQRRQPSAWLPSTEVGDPLCKLRSLQSKVLPVSRFCRQSRWQTDRSWPLLSRLCWTWCVCVFVVGWYLAPEHEAEAIISERTALNTQRGKKIQFSFPFLLLAT